MNLQFIGAVVLAASSWALVAYRDYARAQGLPVGRWLSGPGISWALAAAVVGLVWAPGLTAFRGWGSPLFWKIPAILVGGWLAAWLATLALRQWVQMVAMLGWVVGFVLLTIRF